MNKTSTNHKFSGSFPDIKILKEHEYFYTSLDSNHFDADYPINYGLVLIYSFLKWIKKYPQEDKNILFARIKEKLYFIKSAIQDQREFIDEELFEIYPFYNSNKIKGLLFIDKSEAVFPLVFYSDKYQSDKPRVEAALETVKNMISNFEIIKEGIEDVGDPDNQTQWNQLKEFLVTNGYYEYKKKKNINKNSTDSGW